MTPPGAWGLPDPEVGTLLDVLVTRCPVIVSVVDPHGTYRYSAGTPLARLGLSPGEMVGRDALTSAEADPVARHRMLRALAGEPSGYTWTSPDGSIRFESWLEPVLDEAGVVRAVVGISLDVTDSWRAEASEHVRVLEQQDVLHQLLAVQDAERARISAGLHDDTVQVLAALALRVSTLRRRLPGADPSVVAELSAMSRDLSEAGTRLRGVVAGLQPEVLTRSGLVPALQDLLHRTFQRTATTTHLDAPEGGDEPSDAARRVLYEVAVEAVGNAAKHAQASTVRLAVGRDGGSWVLDVVDDGSGTDVDERTSKGFGLRAMRQRAVAAGGVLLLESSRSAGTSVQVRVPDVPPFLAVQDGQTPSDLRGPLEHILESVNDAFLALDTGWRFVYVNRRAAELFGRTPAELLGRNIWSEFPHVVGHPLQVAYETAMREQRIVEVEEHYEPRDSWYNLRIFPSSSGLTVFVREVTEQHRLRSRQRDTDLGAKVADLWFTALVGDGDARRAVEAAARAVVDAQVVQGLHVVGPGFEVGCGERGADADVVPVTVGPTSLGSIAVTWPGGSSPWTAFLTGKLAQALAARLAPG